MPRSVATIVMGSLLFVLHADALRAQGCCSPGSSFLGGVERGVSPFETLVVTAGYQYTSLASTHLGTERIDDPLRRTAAVGVAALSAEFGLQPRFSILVAGHYAGKRRELSVNDPSGRFRETVSFEGKGIGDVLILGKFAVVPPSFTNPLEVSVGGGASLPVGSTRESAGGSQLSIDLQPGIGAPVLAGWMHTSYGWRDAGVYLSASLLYRYAGPNLDGYRFGDEILGTVGANAGLLETLSAGLHVRLRFARPDAANGRILAATGSSTSDFLGSLEHRDGATTIRAYGALPGYRNVRGIQLTPSHVIGIELSTVIDLRSSE